MPDKLTCTSPRPSRRTSRTAFTAEPPEADDPLLHFAPYLHTAPRGNSITPERQRAFIACLAATGVVTQAARSIGVSLEALYNLRRRAGAEGFAAAWEAAVELGVARLEDCAVELAIAGEELPIVSGGKLLGTYRKHNFGHIRFVLAQRRAERWGAGGVPLAALRPGHSLYERLRREWEEAEFGDDQAVYAAIDTMIDTARRNQAANAAILAEPDVPESDGRDGA